jgi:hypothetical protein
MAGPSELRNEMDELRRLLDAAFNEVIARLTQVEIRVGALTRRAEELARADDTAAQAGESLDLLHAMRTSVDRLAVASERPPPPSEPVIVPAPKVDLSRIEARMAELAELIVSQVDGRNTVDAAFVELRRELAAIRSRPAEVDMKAIEEAAGRGALQNAADIANLRADVVNLGELITAQDKNLTELRHTVGWVKQRLLGR